MSREFYFYAPCVAGGFLGLAAVLYFYGRWATIGAGDWRFHLLNGSGFFLLTYATASGWAFAALCSISILIGVVWKDVSR